MLTEQEFLNGLKRLPTIISSKTGRASYTDFRIEGNKLFFRRNIPKTNWSLEIPVLYNVYRTQKFINTTVVKKITKGRVNSPSVAILQAMSCIDKNGIRM